MRPITPHEVSKNNAKPEAVIAVFNDLIQKYWDGTRARFYPSEAASLIATKMGVETHVIYDYHYLDIEDVYEEAGWKVLYDKPGYYESYPATFEFSIAVPEAPEANVTGV